MNRNCRDHQDALVDTARGLPVDALASDALVAHLHGCDACRTRLEREQALTAGFRAAARSVAGARASEALEMQLLEAFRAEHPPAARADTRTNRWRPWMAAAAAAAILVAGLTWQRTNSATGDAAVTPQPAVAAVSEFVPWPGAASLPAFESGQLVRTELPVSALPLLGLVPAGTVTDNKVLADVLIGQDGLARAVRLATF